MRNNDGRLSSRGTIGHPHFRNRFSRVAFDKKVALCLKNSEWFFPFPNFGKRSF
jgi:hypothetical protein